MKQKALLILNSGSSSIKFQVFSKNEKLELLANGKKELNKNYTYEKALHHIIDWTEQQSWEIKAVAHRVVHGGLKFTKSVLITPQILKQLKKLNPLAPLHQAHNLAAIELITQINPKLTQIGCFDTAFHAQHTPLFTTYALPKSLRAKGIRRYGFHGLSYEWISTLLKKEYPDISTGKVIAAHLGNGASLCAMEEGVSIDTTMGLTALDGLPMGTRCGSLDPGSITYMIRHLNLTAEELEHLFYNQSGLLGLSECSNDVRKLQKSKKKQAQFALDFFCMKVAQFIGMMTISLGGVDTIVFTGGIGENSESIRRSILKSIQCLLPFSVLIIPANEEKMMAMHTLSLLKE